MKSDNQFYGLGIAELENKKIKCISYGYANVAKNETISENSVFHFCSVSKFITAILVMKLVQENVLELEKPINDYLDDWKLLEETGQESSRVTLAHLLIHIGGVCDAENGFYGYRKNKRYPSLNDILNGNTEYNRRKTRIEYEPGDKFEYSDAGFCIIQKVIETVTHEKYEKLSQKYIVEPLNLKHTFWGTKEELLKQKEVLDLVTGYDEDKKPIEDSFVISPDTAASGLWSTPRELMQIIQELLRAIDGESDLLNRKSAEKLLYYKATRFPWVGIGHFFDDDSCIVSKGWGEDAQSILWLDIAKQKAIIVAGNCDPGKPQEETEIGEIVSNFRNRI